jgi:septal ring factor EnvC (AmiA/AmiB activator)
LVDELNKKMSAIENEKDNLKNSNEGNEKAKVSHLRIEKENQQLLAKIEILNDEINQIRANLSKSNEMIDNLNMTIFDQNKTSSKLNSEHATFKRDSEETIKALTKAIEMKEK